MNKAKNLLLLISITQFSFAIIAQNNDEYFIDSLYQVIKANQIDDDSKVDTYLELSKYYIYKDLDSAESYALKGLDLAHKTNYKKGQAVAYIRKCKISEFSDNIDEAISFGNKAISLYETLDKDRNYLVILNIQAYLYEKQTHYDKALELYFKGLKEAKNQENELFKGVFYNNAAAVYAATDHLDESIEFTLKAIKIYKKLGLKKYYGSALNNVGSKYIKKKKYDLATKYLNDARIICLEMNDLSALQKIEENLGSIAHEKGEYELALNHYLKGLEYVEQLDDLDDFKAISVAWSHERLAKVYMDLNLYKLALNHYRKTINFGEKTNSNDLLVNSYYGLFQIYTELNKPDSANYFIQLYLPINDSIKKEVFSKRIEELNFNAKLEKEREKHVLEKNLILLEQKKNQLKLLLVISFLVVVVLSILFLWNIKKNKLIKSELRSKYLSSEKEKLNLDLERSNKELSTSLLNLIERNEFLASISENLDQIKSIDQADDRKKIQDILRKIDRSTTKKLWKEFELCYVKVHKDFFSRLSSKHPNLTHHDRRLCAFTIMNLSIKEISSITYQREQTIKVARYRLRQKLGLAKNENLSSFLNTI